MIAVSGHGLNLLPLVMGDLASGNWRGQFNLDFLVYLILSGLWVAWRGGFSGQSIALGFMASVLGM